MTIIPTPRSSIHPPLLKRDIYPLKRGVDTKNDDSKSEDSRYFDPPPDTLEKLKPCLELLEGIINVGWEVIKEIVVKFFVSDEVQKRILGWLLQSKKLITVYTGDG